MAPYTPESVKAAVEADQEALFAPWAVGRPSQWVCDPRTRQLVTIGQYLVAELTKICANDEDRRTQQDYYNRWSRSREDLWGLAAETLNSVLEGTVEQGRKPHRRWG